MLDLSTHQPFIHVCLIEGLGELVSMTSVLLPKVMFKVFGCFSPESVTVRSRFAMAGWQIFNQLWGRGQLEVGRGLGCSVLPCWLILIM